MQNICIRTINQLRITNIFRKAILLEIKLPLTMNNLTIPSEKNNFLASQTTLITENFKQLFGQPLLGINEKNDISAKELFNAPFVLLSHDNKSEPIFNYANAQALALFELSWEELINFPSRLSAEPLNQQERAGLLAQVKAHGFINNYQGIRISKTGKRFKISNATVWNLLDNEGIYQGQAACFSDWIFL